jgi:hypothetical protein
VESALDVEGVVSADDTMSGRNNGYVQAVAPSNEEVTRVTHSLDEVLVRGEHPSPSVRFEYCGAVVDVERRVSVSPTVDPE